MTRIISVLLLALIIAPVGLPAISCPGDKPCCLEEKLKDKETKAKTYYCPMCKDVKSDKPGKCPKCGMDLKEDVKPQSH